MPGAPTVRLPGRCWEASRCAFTEINIEQFPERRAEMIGAVWPANGSADFHWVRPTWAATTTWPQWSGQANWTRCCGPSTEGREVSWPTSSSNDQGSNGASAANGASGPEHRQFGLRQLYVKDLSFEAPKFPGHPHGERPRSPKSN